MDLNYLIENNYKELHLTACRITGNRSLACDLISETYLDILDRGKVYPLENLDFLKWAKNYLHLHYRSKYGKFKKQLRGKEQPVNILRDLPTPTPEPDINTKDLYQVAKFKSKLDALDKVLFKLIYEDGLTYTEILKLFKDAGREIKRHSLQRLARDLKENIKKIKHGK